MNLFGLNITRERSLKEADRIETTIQSSMNAAKQLNYIASRFSLQKYRYRNYSADQQIYRGYLQSSLGAACISRYEIAYPEPDKILLMNGKPYEDRELLRIIQQPNKWMSETDMDARIIKDQLLTGNSYWIKLRKGKSNRGEVVGWFPFNDMNITPVGTSEAFIEYYKFITFDGLVTEYQPEDVIHLPWIFSNPLYPNKGIAPGALCDLDIDMDTKFGQFIAAFIANDAIPGGMMKVSKDSVAGAAGISETTTKKIKARWRESFTGRGAGDVAILEPGFEFQSLGVPLKDLDLSASRATPEARACALHLIPPEVVGVNVGMAHSTENNLSAAEIRWTNRSLIPLWNFNAKKLTMGIQSEYPGVVVKYDIENVASVKQQKITQAANMATALKELIAAEASGQMPEDAGRATAEFLFQIPVEFADRMFPKQRPPLASVEATPNGEVVESENA